MNFRSVWNRQKMNKAIDTELTAYALLAVTAQMAKSDISTAIPIVQWLSQQRNAYGGFRSTQV